MRILNRKFLLECHELKELATFRAHIVANDLEDLVVAFVEAARPVRTTHPDLAGVCHWLHLTAVVTGVDCLLKAAHGEECKAE
jgi:hypothetical protein